MKFLIMILGIVSFLSAETRINWEGYSPLHAAFVARDEELSDRLIKEGADIHVKDFSGNTPLQCALLHWQKELAKRLIELGSDAKSPNHYGETPLRIAVESGALELIRPLI